MGPRRSTGHASARGTDQKSRLNQKRLDHVFQRAPLLSNGCGQTVHTDRPAVESFHHRQQQTAVEPIQPVLVDFQHIQGTVSNVDGDSAVSFYLGVVSNPPQ